MAENPRALIGGLILLLFIGLALFAPFFAPYDPLENFRGHQLEPPSSEFLLGTDEVSRDILSRLVYGTRVSLLVGVVVVAIGLLVGGSTGIAAGIYGGYIETIAMRLWDAVFAFPVMVMGVLIVAVLGANTGTVALAIGIAAMPSFARVARGRAVQIREERYIAASEIMGAGKVWILVRHAIPNAAGILAVEAAVWMSMAVLAEAALSFIGLGTQPPTPSWGGMLSSSRAYLRQSPGYAILPGVMITALVVTLNVFADGMRQWVDARQS